MDSDNAVFHFLLCFTSGTVNNTAFCLFYFRSSTLLLLKLVHFMPAKIFIRDGEM